MPAREHVMRDPVARAAVDDLMRRIGVDAAVAAARAFGNRAALSYLQRVAAQRRARELLGQGVPRSVINERLAAGFGISRRSAERYTEIALRQRVPDAVARHGHDGGIVTNPATSP